MTLKEFLEKEKIYELSLLEKDELEITDNRRAERLFQGFDLKCALVFLIPYGVSTSVCANISRYAFARDYHLFVKELFERVEKEFPSHFRAACDTSPINEVGAAVKSGLGSIGNHGLLINRRYGSYVFVAELFSDLPPNSEVFKGIVKKDIGQVCLGCNACKRACPTGGIEDKTKCVSFINQKKKVDEGEAEIIKKSRLVWGCDRCQEVCPMNRAKKDTEIEFFRENLTPRLTKKLLSEFIETNEFERRAYSWRGAETLKRNLEIFGSEYEE